MCYSAMVYAEIGKLERKLGIKIDPDWGIERGRRELIPPPVQ
jgi:hypothetical protein